MSRLALTEPQRGPGRRRDGILGIWWLVAHNGGSGWVQAMGDAVFGTLFIGILGPAVVLTCAKIRIASAPVDCIAGMPADIRFGASTRLRICAEPPSRVRPSSGR